MKISRKKGFSLVELLVVVAIIAGLGLMVFSELNPKKRLAESRNASRTSAVGSILSALYMYTNNSNGSFPAGISVNMAEQQIGTGNSATCSPVTTGGCSVAGSTACVDLATPLAPYLPSIPIDPYNSGGYSASKTGYTVKVSSVGIVTVRACGAELGASISISR